MIFINFVIGLVNVLELGLMLIYEYMCVCFEFIYV